MKPLQDFNSRTVRVLFTDIDGTLTDSGRLPARSYDRLERLHHAGIAVIPVTGRPAGWCELIARLWPVHGVVGENGAFYFRFDGQKMRRQFAQSRSERLAGKKKLRLIRDEVLKEIPGAAVASDQFCRVQDLAIDFREDVKPLPESAIDKIVAIFRKHGAQAKVSNIHVNGWFGEHDKVTTCRRYLSEQFSFSPDEMKSFCAFAGDSPNDEPMFAFFPNSFAVANIRGFVSRLKHQPAYVAEGLEAEGFCQIADRLLALKG